MFLALKIASRFLFSNKAQTILITLGIAVGVSVHIFIGSLIQGLQNSLIDKTVGNASQITIRKVENGYIDDYELIVNKITDKDISSVLVTAESPGFVEFNNKTEPIVLRGFSIPDDKIYDIEKSLYEGKIPKQENEVIIGKELKEKLKINLNSSITIQNPSGNRQDVMVVGFYDLGVASLNQKWVISTLGTAQNIFNFGDSVTSIEMQVNDVFQADVIASSLNKELNDQTLQISNWKDLNQDLLSGLQGQSISSIMIQVFVMIAVVLGIASVLAISVLQKSKQLGILKAMGITDLTASYIFLFQGLMLGLIGAIFGIGLGLGLGYSFTKFAVNPDGTPVVDLYINPRFIILSGVIAILAATIASLIPARRSKRLNPIEVIKNG